MPIPAIIAGIIAATSAIGGVAGAAQGVYQAKQQFTRRGYSSEGMNDVYSYGYRNSRYKRGYYKNPPYYNYGTPYEFTPYRSNNYWQNKLRYKYRRRY